MLDALVAREKERDRFERSVWKPLGHGETLKKPAVDLHFGGGADADAGAE